jgi:hypothetical protein
VGCALRQALVEGTAPGREPSEVVMTQPDPHDSHDRLLIASLADRDIEPSDRVRAEAQAAGCVACASLLSDLRSLAAATRDLPSPRRTRDFRLDDAAAARLRPGGWRRFVAAFGTGRDTLSRPLAAGLTTLGLAGLLMGSVPSLLTAAGAAPAELFSQSGDAGVRAPGENDEGALAPATEGEPYAAPGDGGTAAEEPAQERASTDTAAEDPTIALAPDPTGVSGLIVVSGSLLILGIGLFALRWSARRFGG